MKTIVIDREIPIAVFYKAFYRNVQATSFMEEERKSSEAFWHGEMHADGKFTFSYHPIRWRSHGGVRVGKTNPTPKIRGDVSQENGKTIIRYEDKNLWKQSFLTLITLLIFGAFVFGMDILTKRGDLFEWKDAFVLLGFAAIIVIGTCVQNAEFKKLLNQIIEDAKNPPKEENL